MIPAATPRTLWIELTSKCPLDCVFCSRRTRRGAGEHLPYEVFEALVGQLSDPRALVLNYSGESTVYPELLPAIRLARRSGASVELVSALVTVPEAALAGLCASGLNRLTVSVHSTDPERYAQIYRYGTFEVLRTRLTRLVELRRELGTHLVVDLAFVAMERNLGDLPGVAALAESLGLRDIYVFPVIRRDEIPARFSRELNESGGHRPEFAERVREAAGSVAGAVSVTVCNPAFSPNGHAPGEAPLPYPDPLPPGALIHSCEQNPWETVHVLSNGDVVACEVLDRIALGNLRVESLSAIWHGEAYREFRERYQHGKVAECRACPWKRAYRPGPLRSDIIAARGPNAQLLHGWHEPQGESHVWASQQALAVIAPRRGSGAIHVSGTLPPGREGEANELVIRCNGGEIGRIENPWEEAMPFGLDFAVPPGQSSPWHIGFRTRSVYRPSERDTGADHRDLGFALHLLTSRAFVDAEAVARRRRSLRTLPGAIGRIDRIGRLAARCFGWKRSEWPLALGLSIVVPEWDNAAELAECLDACERAMARWPEPVEAIVIVNGSPESEYRRLRERYRNVRWQFCTRPLGFSRAVARGLRIARFDWVYLLNSDVVLDPEALIEAGRRRSPEVFSIASQIVLKDRSRFREETNWTALFLEDGLATIHDRIPESDDTVEGFYAGGGASMFQRRLLRRFARVSAYSPFYWEDVEWGWRARKLGYRSLFCPQSVAHHTGRSTVSRHYPPEEVERITERNRLLFQLRNLTGAGSLQRLCEEAAVSGDLPRWPTLWQAACGRLWNHLAPVSDAEVLLRS